LKFPIAKEVSDEFLREYAPILSIVVQQLQFFHRSELLVSGYKWKI